jgi:hypothetical protein
VAGQGRSEAATGSIEDAEDRRIRDVVPGLSRVGVLWNPASTAAAHYWSEAVRAAESSHSPSFTPARYAAAWKAKL